VLRTIIERFDLYLLILCIVSGAMVAYLDGAKYKREGKEAEFKQGRYVGLGLIAFVFIMYIARFIFV
jgi:hypothetical protein